MVLRDPGNGASLGTLTSVPLLIRNTDPLPSLITMAGVRVVTSGRGKGKATQLLVTFSGPVDAAEARAWASTA